MMRAAFSGSTDNVDSASSTCSPLLSRDQSLAFELVKQVLASVITAEVRGVDGSLRVLHHRSSGGIAQLDSATNDIRLSPGAVLAFACWKAGPCANTTITSRNPTVAKVYTAHLNRLTWSGTAGQQHVSSFVVAGLSAGRTEIVVRVGDEDTVLPVTVLPR